MKNKTKFGLAGIVLAGSLGLGGCAEMGPEFNRDMALLGIALGGAAQIEGIDQGNLELYTAGQNLQALGQYSGNVASSGEISGAIRERNQDEIKTKLVINYIKQIKITTDLRDYYLDKGEIDEANVWEAKRIIAEKKLKELYQ